MLTIDFLSPINVIISASIAGALVLLPIIAKLVKAKAAARHLVTLRNYIFYTFGVVGFFSIGAFSQYYAGREQTASELTAINQVTSGLVINLSTPDTGTANASTSGGLGFFYLILISVALIYGLRLVTRLTETPDAENDPQPKPNKKKSKK